ncbi:HD-GYP domain-containing protein [Methylotenera sp.]|uniref:HD-GYP domain-containing protein n=1 Tax=Methylotenera sp. TaxID=2051956 RepID=UPI002731AD96|nr:HD-GYP domain-containing protein [Methylotenera sp.]MDP1522530.1 HD-GYP domain-containing protein [Methylotenera sp.]MDP2229822.1 HD-GYP domain-containing protein [Methylotenera sp.]MDP3141097.1 HD-GYP domain-containing protein [Methylotenera sp.]MDP3308731.1 HD-GYP domain-containing protein [Methylotenera sp.]MDP3818956.1 HD-GYP domain-containing protein [Methylotenera sp.]
MQALKLSELIGALSHALDITEGQPEGHCIRCCWIGMHIGEKLGMATEQLWELYYTLLLKDLGCSSNASRICELYLTDDLSFKRDFKWVDGSLPQVLRFVLRHTGPSAGLIDRLKTLGGILTNGDEIAQELILTRCTRGADIARQLRFSEGVAQGIHSLDEHWNGQGRPEGLAGSRIPLYSRIALLAQVIDVVNSSEGQPAALTEIQKRRGTWFDPEAVDAFMAVAQSADFWSILNSPDVEALVFALEPGGQQVPLDEDYFDDIAEAFGKVVDAKSPYTAGHSARVGLYTTLLAESMEIPESRRRWLKRGALLHDVGKLGVSNSILDKPGKLDADEWSAVQRHAAYTEAILGRVSNFDELARVSAAHHERLDGGGYPRGLKDADIAIETRIITTADIFDAITAERPYRGAIPVDKTLVIMSETVGTAIDARCFEHLKNIVQNHPEFFPG